MKTKSYQYNEAKSILNEAVGLTPDQTAEHIRSKEKDWISFSPLAIEVIKEIEAEGKLAYNRCVADILLKKLGLSDNIKTGQRE